MTTLHNATHLDPEDLKSLIDAAQAWVADRTEAWEIMLESGTSTQDVVNLAGEAVRVAAAREFPLPDSEIDFESRAIAEALAHIENLRNVFEELLIGYAVSTISSELS